MWCDGKPFTYHVSGAKEMKALAGLLLVLACVVVLGMVRTRSGEPVAFLENDSAQSAFMMSWLFAFTLGSALLLQHFGK